MIDARFDELRTAIVRLRTSGISPEEVRRQAHQFGQMACEPPLDAATVDAELHRLNGHTHEPPREDMFPASIDLAALSTREPQQPNFIVEDLLPTGYATLFAGHGGVGKSALALLLAVCIALGIAFAGLRVERHRVLYLSCEDRENVLHWRLARICGYLDVGIAELVGHLDIRDLVGYDALLWAPDRTGAPYTARYGELTDIVRASGAEVIMVDGISDTFGGSEISRSDAKRFTNAMVGLIPPATGAVLLIGHVAKPTASNSATSEGYSGSTGWHNAVRARWYLYPEVEKSEDSERAERTGRLLLELQKSNLGAIDQAIAWKWSDEAHMFLPEQVPSHFDRTHQEREERRGILLALRGCIDASVPVPVASTGSRTAYLVLSERAEFPTSLKGGGRPKTRRFWRYIESLRQMKHIAEDGIRRKNRHALAVFIITSEGRATCATC